MPRRRAPSFGNARLPIRQRLSFESEGRLRGGVLLQAAREFHRGGVIVAPYSFSAMSEGSQDRV